MKLLNRSRVQESPGSPRNRETSAIPIAESQWRARARIEGRITRLRVQPWAHGVATLECVLTDETGSLSIVFLGRRKVEGVVLGRRLVAEGMVGQRRGELLILNPAYTLLAH